ncbi:MAG TPA: hypothetical protein VM492_05400, partial [Sumerlaeia bacterium]|nr:hypothetical protein [Sumerlaeia bacterium]
EGSPEWVLRVVAEMRPDFVISTANILWVGLLRADPRFLADYEEVQVISNYPALPVYIFQRRTARA